MYMTWRKEMIELARDGRGGLLVAVFGALLLLSVWMNHVRVQETRDANQTAARAEYDRWLSQGERWAHSAAHYGMWAFKPIGSLSVVDPGIEPYVGSAVWLEAHYQNAPLHRPAQDATLIERFGALSPAIVFGVIAPLMLILLGFGAVARERERGVWMLAIAQGARSGPMLWAKTFALLAWLLLAAAPGVALLIWSVCFSSIGAMDNFGRLLAWIAVFAVYLAVFATLVVAVSALARSSLAALGALLAAWVVVTVWLPRLAPQIANAVEALPTQQAFSEQMGSSLGDAEGADAAEALKAQLLREYGVDRVEDLPINWTGISLQQSETRSAVVFDRFWGELFDAIDAQQRLQSWFGIISPSLGVKMLSERLAGSDFLHHRAFLSQAEQHRRIIQETLNTELTRHPDRDGTRHLSNRELWERIPAFEFTGPPASRLLRVSAVELSSLIVWALLAVVLIRIASRASSETLS
jgi:ABC-2 type transport system permease protein